MKKKYIIELPENTHWIEWLMTVPEEHRLHMGFKHVKDLTPYTEPDLDAIRKEEYYKGFQAGSANTSLVITDNTIRERIEEAYQQGLSDAWDALKKIRQMSFETRKEVFGSDVLKEIYEFPVSECIEKIRQYEQRQYEQIQVGDEVEWNGDRYTVTYIDVDEAYVDVIDCSCGSVCDRLAIKAITKTGRHFPEIAEVLARMRGEA